MQAVYRQLPSGHLVLPSLPQQTKVYHHSCYNSHEAEVKLVKSQEKVDAARNNTHRHKKALEKEAEVGGN